LLDEHCFASVVVIQLCAPTVLALELRMPTSDERPTEPADIRIEQELRSANEEWGRALAQRDEAALDRVIADDFVLAYPFEGDDKSQFIADVLAGRVNVESLESHGTTIRVAGATGIVFGTETANWNYRGRNLTGVYRFVRVYTREDGKWRIVALHLCSPSRH
jgi:ketosteroid isomerase-like protein